ncbi:transcriptional regulator [Natronosporangium hydrolyticum]|uniref:Transcriptional regulator n=1 Tax=Natronosporangium hydrolyticum TaxID=2811111 RepID=A0A895Y9D9_9ACTN|nr:winged helix-turn-helix transcriptional regulator [Natronosporangium hydrolyticum]QSB14357.1 transcriptional regulator [Natronosporangium hydrolyticum]
MPVRRSYHDPCGVARALDAIGERWALLLVRELRLGPKRFTDLRRGLPGASQNVLSQRLRELTDAGVVRRRRLGPPASAWGYELTERGHQLAPVLRELAHWGSRAPLPTGGELSTDAILLALETTFDPAAAGELSAQIELQLNDDHCWATIESGSLRVGRGDPPAGAADATIATDPATLRALVFGGYPLVDAAAQGRAEITGDRALGARFLTLFPRPTPD